jgi:hypothetical protein
MKLSHSLKKKHRFRIPKPFEVRKRSVQDTGLPKSTKATKPEPAPQNKPSISIVAPVDKTDPGPYDPALASVNNLDCEDIKNGVRKEKTVPAEDDASHANDVSYAKK